MNEKHLHEFVTREFRRRGINPIGVSVRAFPGETIVVVEVTHSEDQARSVARDLDSQIESGFITVRLVPSASTRSQRVEKLTVHSDQVTELIELVYARSRASEIQPSIHYIPDVAERIKLAVSPRHTLIFGRRGVGKTALMLEARRQVELNGSLAVWLNVQSLRGQDSSQAFIAVAQRICRSALATYAHRDQESLAQSSLADLVKRLEDARNATDVRAASSMLVSDLQHQLSAFGLASGCSIYVFLDDLHYLSSSDVPAFLDLVHGVSRDAKVWIKAAAIKHQTRWFSPDPPTGLQSGHDAILVDLDVTLEEPRKAKIFLRRVLEGFAESVSATRVRDFVSSPALDRLVLASGGVPRDFLTLCAEALQVARQRSNARSAGVQDVNNAAGQAAKLKLQELAEDAAAQQGRSDELLRALDELRRFMLDVHHITFARIDFRDKELQKEEYALIQGLMDLRMLHIVSSSLSDKHEAGRRSEVYLLDLSQYSGSRLKQKLKVLDFEGDKLLLKETRASSPPKKADTPRGLIDLLREGPEFPLPNLTFALHRSKTEN